MLLKASRQQYAHRLLLVQRHTEDIQRWLSNMADQFEWISQLFRGGRCPGDIFSMAAVRLCLSFKWIKPQEVLCLLDSYVMSRCDLNLLPFRCPHSSR